MPVIPNSVAAGVAETTRPSATVAAAPASSTTTPVPAPSAVLAANSSQPAPGYSARTLRAAGPSPVPWAAAIAHSAPQAMVATNPVTTAFVVGMALTNVVQFAVAMTISALSAAPPGPFTATPTLRLNGFDIVPTSTEEVTSFYGRWAYMPGAPGAIQGRQSFGVVDPKTGGEVGTFDALVSRGNGIGYTELLVTSNGGTNIGTAVAQVPPAGSLISNLQLGLIGFSYSAMPAPSGDVVSFTITTPFGDIRIPLPFDYAKGIADHTVDNRPILLGDGYSIAPADPAGETLTAISGVLPGFTTVQGHQVFSVYDSAGHPVGNFDGVFTTTADPFFYTQAIMVTANDGTNTGTAPGQVPPVGSVYNVLYFGTDNISFLYSSLPTPGVDDVSVVGIYRGKVTRSAVTAIDASAPPVTTLSAAGGYLFVPTSELQPSGVNGLPPREVQVQGYQQFDVFDAAGTRIGTVDADVFTQWDAFGVHSKALLITGVTQGGSDVPPAGSIFNFVNSGDSGFGAAHSTVPWASGNLTSFKLVTPLGDIPLPATHIRPASRTPVSFYSPFGSV